MRPEKHGSIQATDTLESAHLGAYWLFFLIYVHLSISQLEKEPTKIGKIMVWCSAWSYPHKHLHILATSRNKMNESPKYRLRKHNYTWCLMLNNGGFMPKMEKCHSGSEI